VEHRRQTRSGDGLVERVCELGVREEALQVGVELEPARPLRDEPAGLIDGVAAVESLRLLVGQVVYGDAVAIEAHQLVCAGEMQLKLIVPSLPYALT